MMTSSSDDDFLSGTFSTAFLMTLIEIGCGSGAFTGDLCETTTDTCCAVAFSFLTIFTASEEVGPGLETGGTFGAGWTCKDRFVMLVDETNE